MAFLRRNSIWLLFLQIIALAGSQGLAQTELDMERALEMYVDRNLNLQAAREQVEMARGRLNQAGLLPNPEFNFTQEGFPVGQSNASFFNDSTLNFWATQELELGGKRGHRKRVADFDVQATESELQDFIRLGKAAVKEAFVRTYVAQEKLRLAQEQLGSKCCG